MSARSNESFWNLLDRLLTEKPFNKQLLESILGTSLRRVDRNKSYEFYEGDASLVQGISIQRVDLRVKKNATNVGLISIDITGPCVTLAEIKKRYEALSITPTSGNSPNEQIYYTTVYPWGSLSFGFPQEPSDCLASVIVNAPGAVEG